LLLEGLAVGDMMAPEVRTSGCSEPLPYFGSTFATGAANVEVQDFVADSPRITMSGADAGVSFWSSHDPERGTTATVISTTIGGAWPVVEIVESHT
jgi:hypothetical protein